MNAQQEKIMAWALGIGFVVMVVGAVVLSLHHWGYL
jgi:hypothetical protein